MNDDLKTNQIKNQNTNINTNSDSTVYKKKLTQLWVFNVVVILLALGIYFYPQGQQDLLISENKNLLHDLAQTKAQNIARWMIKNKFEFIDFSSTEDSSADQVRGLASLPSNGDSKTGVQDVDIPLAMRKKIKKFSGEVGHDPWGRPFLFFVSGGTPEGGQAPTGAGSKDSVVFILSRGENGDQETQSLDSLSVTDENIITSGDDILVRVAVANE